MKNMKKMLTLVLAAITIFALSTTVFAANTITISNSVDGETYNVYKVFDAVGDGAGHINYTLMSSKSDVPAGSQFALNPADQVIFTGTDLTAADLAAIKTYVASDSPVATGTGNGSDLVLPVSDDGYYYITTTTGSLVTIDSANHNAVVIDKNEAPTVEKEVQENSTGVWGETNDASIGQTVNFKTTITAKKGATNYVLHDTMETGLTFTASSVVIAGLTEGTHYTLVTAPSDGCTFEIEFEQSYLDTITADTDIVVTYSAVLNAAAEISTETNDNKTKLTYGDASETEWDTTKTSTYKFDLVKTDGDTDKMITGAEFKLYDALTGGNEIVLFKVSDGVYRPAIGTETPSDIEVGKATIQGLDAGTYYLEETVVPEGYNGLTARQPVTVSDTYSAVEFDTDGETYLSGGVAVENNAGATLPSTGGIGTTIFYALGAVLLVGAGIILVTRKRVGEE